MKLTSSQVTNEQSHFYTPIPSPPYSIMAWTRPNSPMYCSIITITTIIIIINLTANGLLPDGSG
jgi:hypothetical protein